MDSKANEVAEMLECPVCGTFLEADEIDVHANAHFEPPPTERDQPAPLETVDDEKVTFDDLTTATNNSVGTGAARLDALPNGTIAIIFRLLSESADTNRAFLCHVSAKPFRDAPGQGGNWSCGYRNSQSLLASCLAVFPDLAGRVRENTGKSGVPDIVDIQRMIERAWRKGADPGGRDHFRGKLVATKEWIGGTEVAVLLNHLGLKYRVVDFHRPADAQQNHPLLLEWVAGYFGADVSDDGPTSEKVVLTSKLPLYFQHQGKFGLR